MSTQPKQVKRTTKQALAELIEKSIKVCNKDVDLMEFRRYVEGLKKEFFK